METGKTITTIFMFPTLGIEKSDRVENNFINAYSFDEAKDVQYEDCILLLFRPDNHARFRMFLEKERKRTKDFIDEYDYEGGYVVLVYKLPSKFKTDFNLVREGKYSKTSPAFQKEFAHTVHILTSTGGTVEKISLQYRIFNKTQDLIRYWEDKTGITLGTEDEVWSKFMEERETLTLADVKVEVS